MKDWFDPNETPRREYPDIKLRSDKITELRTAVGAVIRGKSDTVKIALVGLLAKGHLLIEDVPGIGKTTLANALARAIHLDLQRIQFTSDLLPSDIIGLSVFNQKSGDFEWKAGPIFANIVLADEINRATPKTQSALIEAMAEEQVTVEGVTRLLPQPFIVIATQNPSDHHGTYPLPESQLDRFMLRLHIGYPSVEDERSILRDRETADPISSIKPVISREDLISLQSMVTTVRMDDALLDYLLTIVDATRRSENIELGISPRGALALFRSAQANALVDGRDYCIADDIKGLVIPCFGHRIIVSTRSAAARNNTAEAERVLLDIVGSVPVPI